MTEMYKKNNITILFFKENKNKKTLNDMSSFKNDFSLQADQQVDYGSPFPLLTPFPPPPPPPSPASPSRGTLSIYPKQQTAPFGLQYQAFPAPKDYAKNIHTHREIIRNFFMEQFMIMRSPMSDHDKHCLVMMLEMVIEKLPQFIAKYCTDAYLLFCKSELEIQYKTVREEYIYFQQEQKSPGPNLYDNFVLEFGEDTGSNNISKSLLFFLLLLRVMYDFIRILSFYPDDGQKKTLHLSIETYFLLIIQTYSLFWALDNQEEIKNLFTRIPTLQSLLRKNTMDPHQIKKQLRQKSGGGGGGRAVSKRQEGCENMIVNGTDTLYDYYLILGMYVYRLQQIYPPLYMFLIPPPQQQQELNKQIYKKIFKQIYGIDPIKFPFQFRQEMQIPSYQNTKMFTQLQPKLVQGGQGAT